MSTAERAETMRTVIAVLFLFSLAVPAFAQDQPKETVKPFTYKKTKQADLAMHVHFPPDWKKDDLRPVIVFFFEAKKCCAGCSDRVRGTAFFSIERHSARRLPCFG